MSSPDQPSEVIAPAGAPKESVVVEPVQTRPVRPAPVSPKPRRGGAMGGLALLLALLALAAAAYLGWQQWQRQRGSVANGRSLSSLQQQVGALKGELASLKAARTSVSQRLDAADQGNRATQGDLQSQSERLRHLEDAVARLAQSSLSGHDASMLDETQSLLRMAQERYTLFHDAQGAAAAYQLASQTLAQVNDAGFAGLRQTIDREHDALQQSQPASQAAALDQLAALRNAIMTLPLKPLDRGASQPATDAWSRISRALGAVISVQHDNGAPLAVADARLARELAELDLAQAQAALLAYDAPTYTQALARVRDALQQQFDSEAPAVQQALATLKQLPSALPSSAPVVLGAALKELRNLRAVDAAGPAPAASAAAPSASTPAPAVSAAPAGGARP